jgi:cell wall-associated NlpC family hydrolase
MVDGINELSGFPLLAITGRHGRGSRYGRAEEDSRECPGPISEATLHRPSTRRVLTAGAIVLAAVVPAIDPIESPADSVNALPPLTPVRMDSPTLAVYEAFQARMLDARRASRPTARRAVSVRPAAKRTYRHPAAFSAARETALVSPVAEVRRAPVVRTTRARSEAHTTRPVVQHRRIYRAVVTKHAVSTRSLRRVALRGGMSAVITYARSQVGRSYVTGGEGGSGFDCSGLTRRAYAQAGIELPHSSRAQAARARNISRGQARPGDLVVGPGHVGIYMGHGMMIDAGNHRTGVVYRKLYSGLRVGRL